MYVDIELDKPRKLRYDLEVILDLESATGRSLGAITRELSTVSFTLTIACLIAGLKHEDKSLTPNLVRKILKEYLKQPKSPGLRPVLKAINDAIDKSGLLATGEEETEGNEQPAEQKTA